ncbi:P-loop ATPase, Sll1717 family [Methanohalophilus halophilus]|uniref:Uncharacterized protein n=1 Tax=Methanohalophilus halophilus TaxID=2177 RepID=A0A1L3Q4K3_9EURY|nr:hypothetical protein [Methanohalophilus halophilus]APH39775.1 hypothetical protein BHR79_10005 [Methanohalophilus halophilus]RNI08884.1 hypothetical protein EFE40_05255 [Methanohalophilus halophilus]SDW40055.1 hypothetical protein SAMN04515625_0921 [Methanohalophilus halophilus]
MDEIDFFNGLGFDSNPFASTNADDEDRLNQYFIRPKYFDSVWGNPERPKSVIVFAPRGGGKTAQRKMIEFESQRSKNVLCVNYSRFEFSKDIQSITVSDHLRKLIQIIIIGILTRLNEEPQLIGHLDSNDRQFLKNSIDVHLGQISEYDFKDAIDSLSNYSDKAKEYWNKYLGKISVGINLAVLKLGVNTENTNQDPISEALDGSYKYQLEKMQNIISKIDFSGIYILIDKVDEADITGNDANLSSKLVEPLLKDLDLLEMNGYSFKFFLWDKLMRYYDKYGRKDRIKHHSLSWDNFSLKKMVSKRLEAYSNNRINDFSDIVNYDFNIDINSIIILFAQKSPRDVIRIIQDIIAEQREINPYARKISSSAIMKGIDIFTQTKASEIVDISTLRELRKIGQVEFTINYLANDVYKCKQDTVRSKIKRWSDLGIIENIGKEKGRKKPVNKYCISDITIAKCIFPELSIEEFLNSKYRKCPNCGADLFRDWDKSDKKICHICSKESKSTGTKFSEKMFDTQQKTLFDF